MQLMIVQNGTPSICFNGNIFNFNITHDTLAMCEKIPV